MVADAMLLEVEGLSYGYHGAAVGAGVSFALQSGQVLCLLGPNGCGKSTLFRTILGLLPSLAGEVRLEGEATAGWSRRRLAQRVAYVAQSHQPVFAFSVRDQVLMGRTVHLGPLAGPGPADEAVAQACLERLNIAHLAARAFPELSGGEQQLVLIARALAQDPRLLVMDEPTASLDFGNRVTLLSEIRRLADQGLGVVLSTHDPDHALQIADRVVLLERGGALAVGTPEETITAAHLAQVYGVPVDLVLLPGGRRVCVGTVPPRSV